MKEQKFVKIELTFTLSGVPVSIIVATESMDHFAKFIGDNMVGKRVSDITDIDGRRYLLKHTVFNKGALMVEV